MMAMWEAPYGLTLFSLNLTMHEDTVSMLWFRNHYRELKISPRNTISLVPINSFQSIDILTRILQNINIMDAINQSSANLDSE